MTTPSSGKGSRKPSALWPQLNARIEPTLYRALLAHLADPLLPTTPKGALARFLELAIRNELTRQGVSCNSPAAIPSSDSLSSGTPPPLHPSF